MRGKDRPGLGEPWHELDVCDSTNDELARLASAGASHGTTLITREQRQGRGRQGRAWQSAAGNLYGSILLRPSVPPSQVAPLALVVGLAVASALESIGVTAQIKWPNDIVVGARKLGGILAEASSRGAVLEHVIVGVGINIGVVPPAVRDIATSVAELGGDAAAADLLRRIAGCLGPKLAVFEGEGIAGHRDEFLERWRDRGHPARATVGTDVIHGTAIDVTSDGALVLLDGSGERVAVVAGEVEIDYA